LNAYDVCRYVYECTDVGRWVGKFIDCQNINLYIRIQKKIKTNLSSCILYFIAALALSKLYILSWYE
jgi:hypothetical protein